MFVCLNVQTLIRLFVGRYGSFLWPIGSFYATWCVCWTTSTSGRRRTRWRRTTCPSASLPACCGPRGNRARWTPRRPLWSSWLSTLGRFSGRWQWRCLVSSRSDCSSFTVSRRLDCNVVPGRVFAQFVLKSDSWFELIILLYSHNLSFRLLFIHKKSLRLFKGQIQSLLHNKATGLYEKCIYITYAYKGNGHRTFQWFPLHIYRLHVIINRKVVEFLFNSITKGTVNSTVLGQ